jgi:hypothetical protein
MMAESLARITRPDTLNFICPSGLGDTMYLASYRAYFERKYGVPVHFIIKPSHQIVMGMYDSDSFSVYEFKENELAGIGRENNAPKKGGLYVAHPLYSDADLLAGWCREAYDVKRLFSRFFHIEEGTEPVPPVNYPELSSAMMDSFEFAVPDMDKTALLLPEVRSVKPLNRKYWEKLAKKLRKKGFFVVQSYTKREFGVEDVPALPESLDTVAAFAISCGRVYSLRSGLCDLIAHKAKDMTVFYPDVFSYKVYRLPGENIRNVLVRDVFAEVKQRGIEVKRSGKKIIRKVVALPVIKQVLGFFVKVLCKVINACIKRSFIHIDYAPEFKTLKKTCGEAYYDMNRMWNYATALIGYFTADIKENTILLIEPNDCHGEVIPGFAKYLLDLGYAVDIIMIWELSWMQPLCRFNDPGIRTMVIPHSFINDLFDKPVTKNYKKILLTSFRVYSHSNTTEGMEIFECYPNVKNHIDRLIAVEHHAEKRNEELLNQNRIITLESFDYTRKTGVCNPHYFGPVKTVPKSGAATKFIAVGKIETERRNHCLLIDAVKELKKQKITNFKIIVIGPGAVPDLPSGIRCFFEFRGWVDFPAMYSAMEEADFFLPLLDMDLPAHKRYIDRATSGSFQLIYGFTKPCLIQRPFAPKRGLTEKNSLLYDKNSDLAGTMLKAIEMTDFEYEDMREDLQKLAEKIYADSRNNLKRIIDEE